MNKVIPLVALATAAVVTSLIMSGCSDDKQAKNEPTSQKHLATFLSLHNKFCEKHYDSREILQKAIESDSSFKQAKGFEGVYETMVDNISFAVSPEDDGCTTDVMVQNGESAPIFRFEDINQALIAKGYKETGKQTSRKDVGTDQSELTIIKKTYISPTGEITTLDFPLEKMDKYYMTLFAEKFTEAKHEIKNKSVNSLKMASTI